jgi:hypothetical protein
MSGQFEDEVIRLRPCRELVVIHLRSVAIHPTPAISSAPLAQR